MVAPGRRKRASANVAAGLEAEVDDWASNYRARIIIGELQHRKVLHYAQMNRLKERYAWED